MFRIDLDYGLIFLGTVLAVLLIAFGALGQEPHHDENFHAAGDVPIHERFYSTWMVPPLRNSSCCNKKDCYPTQFRQVGGTWFAMRKEDGEWIAIPEERLEHNQADPEESPDGQSHVCMRAPGMDNMVFCAVLGSGQ